MIRKSFIVLVLSLAFILPLQAAGEPLELKTDQDRLSYVVGSQVGSSLKRQGIEPDFDVLIQAIKDVYTDQASRFSAEEQQKILQQFQAELSRKQAIASLGEDAWKVQLEKPKMMTFDSKTNYYWVLTTNKGTMKFKLMPDEAPMHVTSTIYLTQKGFYDGLVFHRIIPGFMAQGGCPFGTGTGGPGYQYDGEFSSLVTHNKPYLLSMANAGTGTDGSQFFITFASASHLDGKHTIFGSLVEGQGVVKTMETLGSSSGKPKESVIIEKATIEEVAY